MKKFNQRTALILFPILLIAILLEISLRNIPNNYAYKKQLLDSIGPNIEVLALGSSHTVAGVNPKFFNFNTFNAAHSGQTIDLDEKIFTKYESTFDKLKLITLPIDYSSLFININNSPNSWFRLKSYIIYYEIHKSTDIRNFSEILTYGFKTNIIRLINYYLLKLNPISCDHLGYRFKVPPQMDLIKTGEQNATKHTLSNPVLQEENKEALKTLIENAINKNFKIIFYTSPAYHSYVENLSTDQLNLTIATMDSIANQYTNIYYINYLTDKRFTDQDFYNATHLNKKGAEKFSTILNKEVNNVLSEELVK